MRRALFLLLPLLLLHASPAALAAEDVAPRLRAALVRLHVTAQGYEQSTPWNKAAPNTTISRGVVIAEGMILTPASNVADQILIEVSVANSARRYPARLKHADASRGLALVEITDEGLRAQLKPLEVGNPVKLDDEFDLYQLGEENLVERSTGRVVRADTDGARLLLQLKTTCGDRGDGQVALRDGKLAGLLLATNPPRQEGTLLSVETLRRYLDDGADGSYQGGPQAGLFWTQLLRDDLREYHRVPPDQHGILVSRVRPGRTGDGVLETGDVVTSIDGHALDDEGTFVHEVHGRLSAAYLLQGNRNAGETVPATILRMGEAREVQLTLKDWPLREQRVPATHGGEPPEYLVVGGLVILELTGDQVAGQIRSLGALTLRRYHERAAWDPPEERRRIVFVDNVLSDPANKGFEDLGQAVIASVNGRKILEIADVAAALEEPEGGFHVFRFEGLESDFVLPAAKLAEIDARIAENYKVTAPRRLRDR
ncbi:MAG: PDZ domain-containing protein [Planctomycetaceae bacterium]